MSKSDWINDRTITIRLPGAMVDYLHSYNRREGGIFLSEAVRRIIGQHEIVVEKADGKDIFELGPFGEAPICPKCRIEAAEWSYAQLRWKIYCKTCTKQGIGKRASKKLTPEQLSSPPECECACGRPVSPNRWGTGWLKYYDVRVCAGRWKKLDFDRRIALGEFGDPPLCECGCGDRVKFAYDLGRWNKRIINHNNGNFGNLAIKQKSLDARRRKALEKAQRYAHETKARLASRPIIKIVPKKTVPKYNLDDLPFCECGCRGKVSKPKNRFILGHKNMMLARLAKERRGEPPKCKCGCGEEVKWNTRQKKWNMYYGKHATRDPEYRKRMSNVMNMEHKKAELIIKGALNFRDPEYIAKLNRRPNGLEMLFDSLTDESVKYVGDGKKWVVLPNGRSKNPDFLIGKDKVIELHGDYWHKGEDDGELIKLYKEIGYDCLVIWEREFDNLDNVLQKVAEFIGKEQWQMSFNIGV